jgi:hypothetical protein
LQSNAGMAWTVQDDLRLTLKLGLRKGLKLVRGMRRSLSNEEEDRVADAVADQLRLSNWRIEPGAPVVGHGSHLMGSPSKEP